MSQAVILNLDLAVTDVDVLGANNPGAMDFDDETTARLQAEVESRVREFQQNIELQQAQLLQTNQALTQALEQVKQIHAQSIEEMRHRAVDLALAIARKVIAQEVQAQRVEIDPIVLEALQQLPTRGEVVIHLNPEDLQRSGFAEEAQNAHTQDLKFISDPSISPGGCLVESIEGRVDATIESSLKKVGEVLRTPEGE